jgi:hypothetical protein
MNTLDLDCEPLTVNGTMMKVLSIKWIAFIVILLLCSSSTEAQRKGAKQREQDAIANYVVDSTTYNQVLDLLFPRDVLVGAWGYAFVIRYAPTFDTESQITILNKNGIIEVVEYTPAEGNISRQLKRILPRIGDFNAKGAAKQIKIRRRVISISPEFVRQLRDTFYDRLDQLRSQEKEFTSRDAGTINVIDDGTQYLLWYRGKVTIQFDIIGTNVGSQSLPDESPLLDWMKNVHRIIKQLPAASGNNP